MYFKWFIFNYLGVLYTSSISDRPIFLFHIWSHILWFRSYNIVDTVRSWRSFQYNIDICCKVFGNCNCRSFLQRRRYIFCKSPLYIAIFWKKRQQKRLIFPSAIFEILIKNLHCCFTGSNDKNGRYAQKNNLGKKKNSG